jgi:hypothetical protein
MDRGNFKIIFDKSENAVTYLRDHKFWIGDYVLFQGEPYKIKSIHLNVNDSGVTLQYECAGGYVKYFLQEHELTLLQVAT